MSASLLTEVVTRFNGALQFHSQSASLFSYLSLSGFSALHLYQYHDEAMTQHKLIKYIIENYGTHPTDEPPKSINIIPAAVKSTKRTDYDNHMEAVKAAFKQYERWENDTLALYEDISKQLLENNDIAAFTFLSGIITDVANELSAVKNAIVKYNGMAWDMSQIVGEQPDLATEYRKCLNKLRIGDGLVI